MTNSFDIHSSFQETLDILNSEPNDRTNTGPIKDELNSFFSDSECKEVLITNNTDKMFFGIKVFPEMVHDEDRVKDVIQILTDPKSKRVKSYSVEIDSQIFRVMMYSDVEYKYCGIYILALMIREISGLINDPNPVDKVKNAINNYLTVNGQTLSITKTAQYNELIWFGLCDAMHKVSSVLYTDLTKEFIADEFTNACQLGTNLEVIINAIKKSGLLSNQMDTKLIVLEWALRLYKNVKRFRIDALDTIKECHMFSGSELERRRLVRLANQLKTIDDSLLLNEYGELIETRYLLESKSLTELTNDIYEYAIRVKTVARAEDKDTLMSEINANLNLLGEYIDKDECVSDAEYTRDATITLYNQYMALRDKLANKPVAAEATVVIDGDNIEISVSESVYDKYWL